MTDQNDPAETTEPVEAADETNPAPEGNEPETEPQTDTTPEGAETETTSTEGDEGASEETASQEQDALEEKTQEPEAPETFEVEGEQVPLKDLRDAWKGRKESEKLHKEATDLHNTAKLILTEIPKDPEAVVLDILTAKEHSREKAEGIWDEICKARVVKIWEFSQKPEAERKAIALEKQLQEEKKRNEEFRKRDEAEKAQAATAKRTNELLGEINTAAKAAGLPQDPSIVKRIANVLLTTRGEGHQVTAEEAARLVKEDLTASLKAAPLDELQAHRPELVNEIRKRDLETVRANRQAKTPAKAEPKKRMAEPKQKVINSAEFQTMFGT